MSHKTNFYWLDLIRGLAALLVFLSHIRVLYFLDFSGEEQTTGSILFYFMTGFGHSSVIIFFVLSGFFIIRSIDRSVDSGRWSINSYFLDRLSRLWVVLIPALLFTFLIDRLGVSMFPSSPAYLGKILSLREVNPTDSTTLRIFLGNVFFLQTILVPTFGSNTPLWSLTYEFWYYLIFPIMYFALSSKEKTRVRFVYIVVSILLLFFVGTKIALYYIVWLMGGVTYFLHKNRRWPELEQAVVLCISIVILLGTLTCIRLGMYPVFFNNYTLGIAMSFLVLTLLQYDMPSAWLRRTATFLSNISYTLYLVHMPLSVFITSALTDQRQELDSSNFAIFLILCVGVTLFSFVFWTLFEKQTPKIRQWLKTRVIVQRARILGGLYLASHFTCETLEEPVWMVLFDIA